MSYLKVWLQFLKLVVSLRQVAEPKVGEEAAAEVAAAEVAKGPMAAKAALALSCCVIQLLNLVLNSSSNE